MQIGLLRDAASEIERLRTALDELLDVAERMRGGDPKLDPEQWYATRDRRISASPEMATDKPNMPLLLDLYCGAGLSGAGSKVAAGIVSTRSRPQVTGGGGGFWGPIEGAAGGAVGAVEGAGGSLIKGAEDLINGPVDFFKAMVWLINPLTWLRAVEGLFGFVLILAGVAIVLGADRAIAKAPGPTAGAAALAAEA